MGILTQTAQDFHQRCNPALIWSKFDNNQLGEYGEYIARWQFFRQGYIVLSCRERKTGDFRILEASTGLIYFIEVKTAKKCLSDRSRWHFCMKSHKTDCSYSDFVLLIALDESKPHFFLIPSSLFQGVTHFTLSSHPLSYRGKFAAFRQSHVDLNSALLTADLWTGRLA